MPNRTETILLCSWAENLLSSTASNSYKFRQKKVFCILVWARLTKNTYCSRVFDWFESQIKDWLSIVAHSNLATYQPHQRYKRNYNYADSLTLNLVTMLNSSVLSTMEVIVYVCKLFARDFDQKTLANEW